MIARRPRQGALNRVGPAIAYTYPPPVCVCVAYVYAYAVRRTPYGGVRGRGAAGALTIFMNIANNHEHALSTGRGSNTQYCPYLHPYRRDTRYYLTVDPNHTPRCRVQFRIDPYRRVYTATNRYKNLFPVPVPSKYLSEWYQKIHTVRYIRASRY